MFLIERESKNEIIINKSRFINFLFVINELDDVQKYLDFVKSEYKDATHYCYAFIFENTKRFSDDNEPSGTAGSPMLNVLESKNLNHILTITVRYFGGIKLGSGGLTRAYTKSVTENLKNTRILEYTDGFNFDISVGFELKNKIERIFNNSINSINYDALINYNISIESKKFDEIKDLLKDIEIKNLKQIMVKKTED